MNRATAKSGSTADNTIESAIAQARAELFTGRERELHAFETLLKAGDFPRFVLIHGPGGIGKSSLLDGFAHISEAHGLPFEHIDARLLPATPDTLRAAVTAALPGDNTPAVIAIDHAEQIAALDRWLRLELLPELPLNTVLVLAGRNRPDPEWYVDPGLQTYTEELELRPFDAEEAAEYLRRRQLNPALRDAVQRFARGHPLALALTADHLQWHGAETFDAAEAPDLIQTLVDWMLRDIDDPLKLTALQACATVRCLNNRLLDIMVDDGNSNELYDWLTGLHVVERQERGLMIHDLVRELVVRDLRERDLNRHHTLIRRANNFLLDELENASENIVHQHVADCIYALRHEPHIKHQFPFDDNHSYYPDKAAAEEHTALADEVERLEGLESRRWFNNWLQTDCSRLNVIRNKQQAPVALMLTLTFTADQISTQHDDPAVDRLFHYIREHAPLRGAERVMLLRHHMAHKTHQARTPVWAHLTVLGNSCTFTPGVSFIAFVADLRYDWSGLAEKADTPFLLDTEYTIHGRVHMLIGHDSRREPPIEWARQSTERILRDGITPEVAPPETTVLDKSKFDEALKEALRDFHNDKALNSNPLLRTPVVRRRTDQQTPDALRHLLVKISADHLGGDNHRSPHTALKHAYFQSSGKLAAAAAELHISERTFRRRLREAEAQLTEQLWRMETGV